MGIKIKMNTFEIVRLIGAAPKEILNGIETSILTRMAYFGDKNGKNIRPGLKELVNQLKFCRTSVICALGSLVEKGILIDRSTVKHGKNNVSCYEINLDNLKDLSNKILSLKGASGVPPKGASDVPLHNKLSVQKVRLAYPRGCVRRTPPSASDVPLPYTPHIKPIDNQSIVELGANSTPPPSTKKSKKNWSKEILEVFGHWQKVLNHPKSKLDENRKLKIRKALESGYLVEELKKAIEGVKNTAWNMRENPSGELYDDIPLIFRNSSQIERFIRNFDIPPTPKKENVATGLKSGFLERGREQGKVLDAISREIQSRLLKKGEQQIKQQEHEANELK